MCFGRRQDDWLPDRFLIKYCWLADKWAYSKWYDDDWLIDWSTNWVIMIWLGLDHWHVDSNTPTEQFQLQFLPFSLIDKSRILDRWIQMIRRQQISQEISWFGWSIGWLIDSLYESLESISYFMMMPSTMMNRACWMCAWSNDIAQWVPLDWWIVDFNGRGCLHLLIDWWMDWWIKEHLPSPSLQICWLLVDW